jgi:hypothetical protein
VIPTAASRKRLGVEDLLSHKDKTGKLFRSPVCRLSYFNSSAVVFYSSVIGIMQHAFLTQLRIGRKLIRYSSWTISKLWVFKLHYNLLLCSTKCRAKAGEYASTPMNIFPKVHLIFYFWLLVAGTNSPRTVVKITLSHCIELKPFSCSVWIRHFPNCVSRKVCRA